MKIKNVAIKNFRGYSDEINSDFEDLRLKCTLYYYVCRSAQKVSP